MSDENEMSGSSDISVSDFGTRISSNLSEELNATHTGELILGSVEVPCHVLANGTRVISGRGMQNSLGFSKASSGLALSQFIDSKLVDYLDEDAYLKFKNPLSFKRVGSGGSAPDTFGYDATVLIDICDAAIEANKNGVLSESQKSYADFGEMIIRSVAKVGIVALVDEATGYQYDREQDALQKILDKFLTDERRKWSKTFPDEFWFKLVKTKGYDSYMALRRPSFVGHWVNDIVYARLAPGIKSKLKEINPRTENGNRLVKHHQFLSEDHGLPELRDHLKKVMVLMDASSNLAEFEKLLDKSLPRYNDTLSFQFDENF